jgi:3-oxoacyl-[acyl-carrier protein] reductase
MARSGVILTLSSVAGTRGGRGQGNYAASKGAIEAMTRSLAVELGKRGVRVLSLAPGIIETEMTEDVLALAPEQARSKIVLNRFGSPVEVANVAAFLVSDEASYMTGAVIPVDGGFKMA